MKPEIDNFVHQHLYGRIIIEIFDIGKIDVWKDNVCLERTSF